MESAGGAQKNRKVTHVEKCGLARVESAADSIGKPIDETVGQLMNTDTSLIQWRSGVANFLPFRSVFWAAFSYKLQGKSAQKKPLPVMCPGLAAWGGRLGIAQICGCVGKASFCGRLQLNNKNKANSKTSKD